MADAPDPARGVAGESGQTQVAPPGAGKPALLGSAGLYQAVRLALIVLLLVGVGIALYPLAERLKFEYDSVNMADEYQRALEASGIDAIELEWRMAQEYNRAQAYNLAHHVNTIEDPFAEAPQTKRMNDEYWSLVNPLGNGMMGYMDIPRIGERLVVYHGTDEDALLKGVGHVQGTSLPVGGESTHCVLSGHRGLSNAKVFTDLDQMEVGDLVLMHVLNHDLAYEVDAISVVKPQDISAIEIVQGADLMTLVTCTPYAVNTHRLLVRGHRVPYVEPDMPIQDILAWFTPLRLLAICATLAALAAVVISRRRRKGDGGPAPSSDVASAETP